MTIHSEEEAKRRFLLFAGVRLTGVAVFLLGVFIALTDLVVPGGSPIIGGVLAMFGAIDAVLAPVILRKLVDRA